MKVCCDCKTVRADDTEGCPVCPSTSFVVGEDKSFKYAETGEIECYCGSTLFKALAFMTYSDSEDRLYECTKCRNEITVRITYAEDDQFDLGHFLEDYCDDDDEWEE